MFPLVLELQYRSKVSYHPSSRFSRDETLVSRDETLVSRDETLVSRDETLVSREPLKRIFWNKLQAVSLQGNDKISRRGEVCSARASGVFGLLFYTPLLGETSLDLQAKSLKGKDEKLTPNTFAKTPVRRSLNLFHCSVLTLYTRYKRQL